MAWKEPNVGVFDFSKRKICVPAARFWNNYNFPIPIAWHVSPQTSLFFVLFDANICSEVQC